ncbi:MAG: type II secretion system protein [Sulfuricurvum sp.]|nr:type II secretion system protein [Sulfuricurvum sp.]
MKTARRGFSLIEVLLAVVIASLAGLAMLETASQSRRAYETTLSHRGANETAALVALSAMQNATNTKSTLYLTIGGRYFIDNSAISQKLERKNFEWRRISGDRLRSRKEHNATRLSSDSQITVNKIEIRCDDKSVALYGLGKGNW